MNTKYLGDSLDLWKRAIFCRLIADSVIQNIGIIPMATGKWSEDDKRTYAKMIGIHLKDIAFDDNWLVSRKKRNEYFSQLPLTYKKRDLFFDPDTGLMPTSQKSPKQEHISIEEIKPFLSDGDIKHILIIYQHAHRRKTWIEDSLTRLKVLGYCFGYRGGQVGMLFISKNESRLIQARDSLKKLLASCADKRITVIFPPDKAISR